MTVIKVAENVANVRAHNEKIDQKIDLAKLPSAEGAAFDSHEDEHHERCHPETRVDLLRQIQEWAQDPQGKCIFWLNGKAGTGKSTISRTIAQAFDGSDQLGASFFFKRGEGDRGKAAKFFTTIAAQLVHKVPEMIPLVSKAINADPAISEKRMKEQFEKLILQPLSETKRDTAQISTLVIIIDALDECEREDDIKTILDLLCRMQDIRSIRLRIFVTCRPELPIHLHFKRLPDGAHKDLVLHEIPKQTIGRDIFAFLKDELAKIQREHSLPLEWPGEEIIRTLVEMATPLFIFAATACRFLKDRRLGEDPEEQLNILLKYQTSSQASQFDKTYLPVLGRLQVGLTNLDKEKFAKKFRKIVGSIVILEEPLSVASLARLFDISKSSINSQLDLLHSVLDIPDNPDFPVRLLHLSFRDFLLDPAKRGESLFWVDERETHEMIAAKCLQLLMDETSGPRENVCKLESPGKLRTEINRQSIDACIPAEVRYACRYWVYHLQHSKNMSHYQDKVYTFLKQHFLHWLEAMSLIGRMSESLVMINSLQSLVAVSNNRCCITF
jgi:hypothetical protein